MRIATERCMVKRRENFVIGVDLLVTALLQSQGAKYANKREVGKTLRRN
jgi:hypothetical protein